MKKNLAWAIVKELGKVTIIQPKSGIPAKGIAGKDHDKVIQLVELATALLKGQPRRNDE